MAGGGDDRGYENRFPDFDPNVMGVVDGDHRLIEPSQEQLRTQVVRLLGWLEEGLKQDTNKDDYTVYTGSSGIALLYMHLSEVMDSKDADHYLKKARDLINDALSRLKKRRISFLGGDAGPLALGAVLFSWMHKDAECKELIHQLLKLKKVVMRLDMDLSDEMLYGRAGYLYSLLFVRKYLGNDAIGTDIIKEVVSIILKSGMCSRFEDRRKSALMYAWHGKHYVGAAHGLAGILYMLLKVKEFVTPADLKDCVKPCIDYLLARKFQSGNYPSSLGNSSDKLVHWCHGAAGIVYVMAEAYKVFKEEKYLEAAKECGEVVWQRGLLKKGYGICHGVSGNAYTFVLLFQLTGDLKYAHRAAKFAEWCFDYGRRCDRTPDRPYSLFEGMAGAIYFLADMQVMSKAAFPAFQLE